MKKLLIIFVFIFSAVSAFAQGESVKPTFGVDLEREVSYAKIEGKYYENVTVRLKAAELGDAFAEGVRVIITDNTGKKIYKKRFSKSRLYAFSDGTLQVGKGNALTQISLYKSSNGKWNMNLREKGIY